MRGIVVFVLLLFCFGCIQQPARVEYHGRYSHDTVETKKEPEDLPIKPIVQDKITIKEDTLPVDEVILDERVESKELGDATTEKPAKPVLILEENKPTPKKPQHGFIMPANGSVISNFGRSHNRFNDGVLLALNDGQGILAAAEGTVVYVGQELREYGNMVIIEHKGNVISSYAQMQRTNVKVGERVRKGQVVGYAGVSNESRLLFSIRVNGAAVDPIKYVLE